MKKLFAILPVALLAFSCAREPAVEQAVEADAANVYGAGLPDEAIVSGECNVYVSEALSAELEKYTGSDGMVTLPQVKSIPSDGIVSMERLFPYAGQFEDRTRAAGLHRWYKVHYAEGMSTTKASISFASIAGVEQVELCPRPVMREVSDVKEYVEPSRAASSTLYPFNDPMLPKQWHYYNNGTMVGTSVSGCDINVLPVWENYTTGDQKVVVAVVDGGVDYAHEDLAANMWHNDIDKDCGDDVYGYNFVTKKYKINPEDHGTHVAGTVAAVNNNGKGVCGIAGGNSKKGEKGVRLMSCQIFDGKDGAEGAVAIKWAADHGAVIAQNSWGYTVPMETPASLKAAVDYFIKNAEIPGVMKGGLVVFAAGNDTSQEPYGIDYDQMLIVASVGADFRRAYYSNYGPWVHISAPGGDAKKGNQVVSTFVGNKYGQFQGTSMACPHVSGVAALIVSKKASKTFTSKELRQMLLARTTPIQSFNAAFPMGAGLVNAYMALAGGGGTPPAAPTNLTAAASSNNVDISVTVPSDPDDAKPTVIYVYYDTKEIKSRSDAMFAMFYTAGYNVGDALTGRISGLEFNTKYYVAAAAADIAGNVSSLTRSVIVNTGANNPPQLVPFGAVSASIKAHQKAEIGFDIIEPDDHFYHIDLVPGSDAAVLDTLTRNQPKVVITGIDAPAGSYKATLTVTDIYGLATIQDIPYTILENHAPRTASKMEDVIFNSRASQPIQIPINEYFIDEDGEDLDFKIDNSVATVAHMAVDKGNFLLSPMNFGYTTFTITGTDVRGESVAQSFRVLVRDGSKEVDLYPNPVTTVLNIRTSSDGEIPVRIVNAAGAVVFDETLTVSPFEPAQVDMSTKAPGAYAVILNVDGKELKYNIVKI